ncbi:endonuclease/exonuclease/phosphatase family protein [Cognatilysobacter tabacisoli]|uniref:endonuclease/exonuclease/phosphatase family protein n=1 Tax=Cognatilysobacter tabacisoli TaxID=2315424 RepID=UPI001E33E55C|nr:endonuclease/exonuclease/phosphatase family protein [Lysobacter tabacisoli]
MTAPHAGDVRCRRRFRARSLVMVARGVLAVALLFLAGCAATAWTNGPAPAPSVDVVTLNLWHDRADWPRRRATIVAELARLRPDLIVLQEVLQDTALPNQAASLADALGYTAHFASVDPPSRARRYGNAILTRRPVLARGEHPLQPSGDYRIAAWLRIEVDGRPLDVYAVHLNFTDASGATRARQVADLVGFMRRTAGPGPSVVAGDFNTTAGSAELAALRETHTDSYAAVRGHVDDADASHVTLVPGLHDRPQRIDHVFAQAGALVPERANRILDRAGADGTWPSDHFGVWVRLRFVETAQGR